LDTADGEQERDFLRRIGGDAIGMEDAVDARPLLGADVHPADAQDAFGGRIEQEELARRVGDDEAIAQAVEDGLKELELLAGRLRLWRLGRRRGGATERRRECLSVAWLPALSVSGSVEVGHTFPLWRKWGSPGARERSSLSASLGYSNTPPL